MFKINFVTPAKDERLIGMSREVTYFNDLGNRIKANLQSTDIDMGEQSWLSRTFRLHSGCKAAAIHELDILRKYWLITNELRSLLQYYV